MGLRLGPFNHWYYGLISGKGFTRYPSTMWNAILCVEGLIVRFSSGQSRGKWQERKRIRAKWSIRDPSIPGQVFCRRGGYQPRSVAAARFLWDRRNDAGMFYEGVTGALRPGQWSIIPQTELPRCVKRFSFFAFAEYSFIASFPWELYSKHVIILCQFINYFRYSAMVLLC